MSLSCMMSLWYTLVDHPSCNDDYDGDGVKNDKDICPYNKKISKTDFRDHIIVPLDPEGSSQVDPDWQFNDEVSILTLLFI